MKVSMKNIARQITFVALATTALTLFSGSPLIPSAENQAFAQSQKASKERETRRTPTMREPAFKRLERAQLAMEAKNFAEAKDALEDLRGIRNLNSYEEANLWNFYAFYYFEQDDTANAIASFERILKLPDIPVAFEDNIRYQLAQLYFSEEKYQKALTLLDQWFEFAVDPQASHYTFRGNLYYVLERYDDALPAILKSIELTKAAGLAPKENSYLLLRTIYFEKGDMNKVKDVLEYLVVHFPKPQYWLQLSSIYSELKDEAGQLAAMEVAYKTGALTEESHYMNLAQLYLYNEVPIKAAKVMKEGIDKKVVKESKKSFELFANAYINAKEFEKSIPPLTKAAELSEDGELALRLGQVYMERDNWTKSIDALKQGIAKGSLRRTDQAYMLLGMAYFNNEQLQKAKEAFAESRKDNRSRTQSAQWISYIDREISRRKELGLKSE